MRLPIGVLWLVLLGQGLCAQPASTASSATAPVEAAGAYLKRAVAYRQKGDLPDAMAQLRQALALAPGFADAHRLLGELLLAQGFAADALPHLEAGGNAYLEGVALLELQRLPQAVAKLLVADAQHPDDPAVMFHLAEASGALMQRAYTRVLQAHPNSPPALEIQARNFLAQGRGDQAEAVFRNLLSTAPDLPGVHLELGRILQEQRGDLNGAEREFRAEAQLRPGSSEAAWRLGSVLLKKGQTNEALSELRRADQLRPDMLDTLLDLGKAYLLENRMEPAEKAFRRVIAIHDAGEIAAAAHLQLSQLYRKLGRAEDADRQLNRFRELSKGPEPR